MISKASRLNLFDHLDLFVSRVGVIEELLKSRRGFLRLRHLSDHSLPLSGLLGSRIVSHLFCESLSQPAVVMGTTTVVSVMLVRLRGRSQSLVQAC